ncbi:MAG: SHOCT domain-containing protein [Nitrospirota bacterium]
MHWWDSYGWGIGFGLGWFLMVAFWVLVILGVIYLVKLITGGVKKEEKGEMALDILKKRYARGEISKEEFERIKDDLTKT